MRWVKLRKVKMACVCFCVEGGGEEYGILKDKVVFRVVGGGEGGGVGRLEKILEGTYG